MHTHARPLTSTFHRLRQHVMALGLCQAQAALPPTKADMKGQRYGCILLSQSIDRKEPSNLPRMAAPYIPPEALELASRMYNAARQGHVDIFEQALPAGLPANLTNEKGDTLVG